MVFSSYKLHIIFITSSFADTQIRCLALHFPILISGKHSQQGLNQTKSNRMEEFEPQSEPLSHHPEQSLSKTQLSWIFPLQQWISVQTQKQQWRFHTNVILKLQHRWYKKTLKYLLRYFHITYYSSSGTANFAPIFNRVLEQSWEWQVINYHSQRQWWGRWEHTLRDGQRSVCTLGSRTRSCDLSPGSSSGQAHDSSSPQGVLHTFLK